MNDQYSRDSDMRNIPKSTFLDSVPNGVPQATPEAPLRSPLEYIVTFPENAEANDAITRVATGQSSYESIGVYSAQLILSTGQILRTSVSLGLEPL